MISHAAWLPLSRVRSILVVGCSTVVVRSFRWSGYSAPTLGQLQGLGGQLGSFSGLKQELSTDAESSAYTERNRSSRSLG